MLPTVPISVAIPAFGNEHALAGTLQRIYACRPLPQEILLHYDGGWEPAIDPSVGAPIPVRIFRSAHRLGPGGGRQVLFHESSCEYIASFDDDSWPLDADYFAKVIALMSAFPDAGVISPIVYLSEKPVLPPLLEASAARSYDGSASIHRKSIHVKLPGYVPVPSAYGVEETDISLQIHAAGYEIIHTPWLRAWHARPQSENAHTILPWIKNEVLLSYLRYPLIAQPWGWVRALRHVLRHRKETSLHSMLRSLAESIPHCAHYSRYKKTCSFGEIWRHHRTPSREWLLKVHAGTVDQLLAVTATPAPPARRILYIQYTNPAAYPPLEHSSQILTSRGWEAEFCGLKGRGGASLELPPNPRVSVRQMNWCNPGMKQKFHYLFFHIWIAWRAWRFRPHWIYCSDALSTSSSLLIRRLTGCRVLYHEHDSPNPTAGKSESGFVSFILKRRKKLAKNADAIVLPNVKRLDKFISDNRPSGRTFCVWNCPSINETARASSRSVVPSDPIRLLYHGSIVPDRFPKIYLQALQQCGPGVSLRLVGYEPPGHLGYTDELVEEARMLGLAERFEYLGPLNRNEMMMKCAECDVGLSMLRIHEGDINMLHMAGASNKPFDYLSQGLALIVSPDPEWNRLYVQSGCAVSCDSSNVSQLAETFAWLRDHRDEVRRMGETGRSLVQSRWNYEAQFQPVLELLESTDATR